MFLLCQSGQHGRLSYLLHYNHCVHYVHSLLHFSTGSVGVVGAGVGAVAHVCDHRDRKVVQDRPIPATPHELENAGKCTAYL